jgi:hypothetical protein
MINETQQHREQERWVMNSVKQSSGRSSTHFIQVFLVVFTALLISISAILRYAQPQLFARIWKRRSVPPFYFATKYPSNVILERDLPRFYQTFSIATPENEIARKAVNKIIRSRTRLRHRLGDTKAILKAWDDANVESLVQRGLCGDDFAQAYHKASSGRQEDLLMWCLVATRVVEGYFKQSVEMIDSAIFLTRKRGMVVKKQAPLGIDDGYGALSTSFYLHPRLNNSSLEWIPSRALAMVISTTENDLMDPSFVQATLEQYLHDLVIAEGNEEDYLILDEICQNERPERAIGVECPDDGGEETACCYFVVPDHYGGRFKLHEDDDN